MAAAQAEQRLALMRAEAEQRLADMRADAERWLADMRAEAGLADRRAAAVPTEFRRTIIAIGVMFSLGTVLLLASFLIPGISWRMQAAAVCFFAVRDFMWRHPVVWFPAMCRWYDRFSVMTRNL